jgi:hypothetical protein
MLCQPETPRLRAISAKSLAVRELSDAEVTTARTSTGVSIRRIDGKAKRDAA